MKGFKSLFLYGYVITDSLKDWAAEAKDEADQDTLIEWIREQEDDNIELYFADMREDDDWFWGKVSGAHSLLRRFGLFNIEATC